MQRRIQGPCVAGEEVGSPKSWFLVDLERALDPPSPIIDDSIMKLTHTNQNYKRLR